MTENSCGAEDRSRWTQSELRGYLIVLQILVMKLSKLSANQIIIREGYWYLGRKHGSCRIIWIHCDGSIKVSQGQWALVLRTLRVIHCKWIQKLASVSGFRTLLTLQFLFYLVKINATESCVCVQRCVLLIWWGGEVSVFYHSATLSQKLDYWRIQLIKSFLYSPSLN